MSLYIYNMDLITTMRIWNRKLNFLSNSIFKKFLGLCSRVTEMCKLSNYEKWLTVKPCPYILIPGRRRPQDHSRNTWIFLEKLQRSNRDKDSSNTLHIERKCVAHVPNIHMPPASQPICNRLLPKPSKGWWFRPYSSSPLLDSK